MVETEGRRETLLSLLAPLKLKPKQIHTLAQATEEKLALMVSPLEHGLLLSRM